MDNNNKKKFTIHFGGSGGCYHYFFGVAALLQDYFDISSLNFESVSGSGFPCCCLAMGVPIRQIYRLWINRKISLIKNNNLLSFFELFYKLVYAHTTEIGKIADISSDNLKNWSHQVKVSPLNTKKPISINEFISSDDYAHLITASAFIPLPFKNFKAWNVKTRNELFFDGMLKFNWWIDIFLFPYYFIRNFLSKFINKKKSQNNNILESKNINLTITSINGNKPFGGLLGLLYYTIVGIFTDCDWMYYRGYLDARNILLPKLLKLGVPLSKKNQIKSNDNLIKFKKCSTNANYLLER